MIFYYVPNIRPTGVVMKMNWIYSLPLKAFWCNLRDVNRYHIIYSERYYNGVVFQVFSTH